MLTISWDESFQSEEVGRNGGREDGREEGERGEGGRENRETYEGSGHLWGSVSHILSTQPTPQPCSTLGSHLCWFTFWSAWHKSGSSGEKQLQLRKCSQNTVLYKVCGALSWLTTDGEGTEPGQAGLKAGWANHGEKPVRIFLHGLCFSSCLSFSQQSTASGIYTK